MNEQKVFSRFPSHTSVTLSSLSLALFEQQKTSWDSLSDGISSLNSVQTRKVQCKTFAVNLQFNPKRIVSSDAKVDEASIKARECFLCVPNLPAEQSGVLYREKFLLLCNPIPIFAQHFTVSHVEHIPQSIEEHIVTLLDLSKDFSSSHSVFYNGPKCGASAPDHMHFQASPKGVIPVENEALLSERRKHHKRVGEVEVFTLANFGRAALILESDKKQDIEFGFLRFTGAIRRVMNTHEEPMMNIICSHSDGMWRIILFPRIKHRPAVYSLKGEEKVMVSPAAVDMGGLIVTPIEKDFRHITPPLIEEIYKEVSVSEEVLDSIIEKM